MINNRTYVDYKCPVKGKHYMTPIIWIFENDHGYFRWLVNRMRSQKNKSSTKVLGKIRMCLDNNGFDSSRWGI